MSRQAESSTDSTAPPHAPMWHSGLQGISSPPLPGTVTEVRIEQLGRREARMRPWANRMGVDITSLDVRDLSYRWGSLGTTGRINIHWAAMQLPVSLVGYVLVHELADTHERNHTELLANRRTHHA